MSDEFYIGYVDKAPPQTVRIIRQTVIGLFAGVVVIAMAVGAFQTPAEPGLFEFGQTRAFEGIYIEHPIPILHAKGPDGSATNYVIVGNGKHGAPESFKGRHGQRIGLNGTLIQKESATMIEAGGDASVRILDSQPANTGGVMRQLGQVTVEGELVDTKCYLGVMRPATGKVHRACAIRCLSGGIPPGILARDADGNGVIILLAGSGQAPPKFDVQWAGRTIAARGELEIDGNLAVLHAESISLSGK